MARQCTTHALQVALETNNVILVPQIIFRNVEIIYGVDSKLLVDLETAVRVSSPLLLGWPLIWHIKLLMLVEVTRHAQDT